MNKLSHIIHEIYMNISTLLNKLDVFLRETTWGQPLFPALRGLILGTGSGSSFLSCFCSQRDIQRWVSVCFNPSNICCSGNHPPSCLPEPHLAPCWTVFVEELCFWVKLLSLFLSVFISDFLREASRRNSAPFCARAAGRNPFTELNI